MRIFLIVLLLVLSGGMADQLAFAQNMSSLQMMSPVAPGAAGTGWDTSNRIYRAYAGIPYSITATARGGHWPYTYALSNAPAGMTIQAGPCADIGPTCTAGTITWTNPQASASNITVQVCDVDHVCVTGTWSIRVSTTIGADGFCFIDAVNGNDSGNGSPASPWRTIAKAWTSCGARSILYLRTGTYATTGMTQTSYPGYGLTVDMNETRNPVIWLAYPGDRPVVDFGSNGGADVQIFQMNGNNLWIDGLEVQNVGNQGFQLQRTNRYGAVVRNNNFHNLRDGENGNNSAFVMWTQNYELPSFWDIVQGNRFDSLAGDGIGSDMACALKLYSIKNAVFEHNTFSNSPFEEAMVAIKGEVPTYTVRANVFFGTNIRTGIGGNMAASPGGDRTGGEIYHNLSISNGPAYAGSLTLGVNLVRNMDPVSIWRNTFVGTISIDNISSIDGPFNFSSNVMVNTGGSGGACPQPLYCMTTVASYAPLVINTNNLVGPNNGTIVSASTGQLQGSYRTSWLGIKGYELGTGGSGVTGSTTPPPAPTNVVIR